ncbi:hypothetical protein JCM19039_2558 [Geomicrobium sp. JCM 19039]|nr:hypothetical protein JCM19039_2558 [Geomicrobium sp. JCM 19039]
MLVPGGGSRSRLFTLRQTFFVLPATLAVTNNDRQRGEFQQTICKHSPAKTHFGHPIQ